MKSASQYTHFDTTGGVVITHAMDLGHCTGHCLDKWIAVVL